MTFTQGYMGSAVSEIQEALISLGYLGGEASGNYDETTAAAVSALQRDLGQPSTGEVDPGLYKMLQEGDYATEEDRKNGIALNGAMVSGSQGEKVMELQRRLIELNYPDVQVTGTYDEATSEAVSTFQGMAELLQTGTASLALQEFILSDNALMYRPSEDLIDSNPGATAADVVYSLGTTGEGVAKLQSRLHTLGYLNGVINGEYGSKTEHAVRTLQAAIGVEQTGVVSSTMLLYVFSNAAPRSGITLYDGTAAKFDRLVLNDRGDAVTALQRRLWDLGFLSSDGVEESIGVYNEATQAAVVSAQQAMGYQDTDGIAGVEFQAFLFSRYGERLTAGN